MHIRYGTTHDAALLAELGTRTFYDTFEQHNTAENMAAYLKESFSIQTQSRELLDPANIFLIAELEVTPVGYAQLIQNSRDNLISGTRPLEVRRIYAVPEYIGRGVGKELMRAVINEARNRGCDCIWLGVWEKNHRAIQFYKRWGFHEVGTHVFSVGNDPQNDFVMLLELT